MKSCQRDDKSPLKGAWFCSRDPFFMRNCGLRKNYPLHCVKCDTQCCRRRATDYHAYGALGHPRKGLGLSSIGSICHSICCNVGCITNIDNESIKWSLSIIVQICGNNRHFLVCIAICYRPTLIAW